MDRETIASYNRSWRVVESRHVDKNRACGFSGLLRDASAGDDCRTKGGNTTKIHELIIGEHLSKQWGEPHGAVGWRAS